MMASCSVSKEKSSIVDQRKVEKIEKARRKLLYCVYHGGEFGIGKSTVYDIKASREKILKFASEAQDEKSMKKGA